LKSPWSWRTLERESAGGKPLGYAIAAAITLATVGIRHALDASWGTARPFMLFFPTIMVAGRIGGLGPGVLSTAVASLAIDYLWMDPVGSLHIPQTNLESFVIFVLSGLLISALNGTLHAALARAAALHRARETLLAIVAHDLRGPLASISLNATLLRRVRTPEQVDRAAETIASSVGRMDRLISDVLDASRVEVGSVEIRLREEEVAPLLREALEASRHQAEEKKIELTIDVGASLPKLRCDRERVLQVLGNLLTNAVRLTPEGGAIKLTARRAGSFLELEVTDTGPGIEPDDLPYVFDRYWKKGNTGTGLGLYIVHGLVEAQGGKTWARSERGRGASFFVSLPIAE
jgi:signal transduction histidine kinase